MSQAGCTAVRAVQGRFWHGIRKRDDLLTWTRCSTSFITARCETTVLADIPPGKRCTRCWGSYIELDTTPTSVTSAEKSAPWETQTTGRGLEGETL